MSGTEIILIDLDKCYGCRRCKNEIPEVYDLIERGIRRLVCRHCENPPCVEACPVDALEKKENEDLLRYSYVCVSCKQCASACPVGANPVEILSYRTFPVYGADFEKCMKICKKKAVSVSENVPEDYVKMGENYALKAQNWKK